MWTWEEINSDWLTGQPLPGSPDLPNRFVLGHTPEEVVESFNVVEARFGRDWIEASRPERSRGSSSTLHIVGIGKLLESLEGVRRAEQLVAKVGRHDPVAYAEARALHLIRGGNRAIEAEYEPPVVIGGRTAVPDFRVRRGTDEPWVYIEVAKPDPSDEQRHLWEVAERMASIITDIARPMVVDVELQRSPTESEVADVAKLIRDTCHAESDAVFVLADGLGRVAMSLSDPDAIVSATVSPAVTVAVAVLGHADGPRRATVTVGYIDDRSQDLLRKEAHQLPKDTPGLVMLDVGQATGTRHWKSVVRSRLQPNLHTRVSGVMLFQSYTIWIRGSVWGLAGSLVKNPHARMSLPDWLLSSLSGWPSIHEVMTTASESRASDATS